MVSGSESAAEKVGPRCAVSPTEDVVQALMETLVDPLLPLKVSTVPPSEDVQIAVAKQMHAVVLLYNYYHRKQKPELAFIEFVDFCKLAIAIRPPLIAFMKLMKEIKLQELNGTEDQLSVTEKVIKDACEISLGLDASRHVPDMEGWPISKVAVLLIDSNKENCMLQFSPVPEGWSLFEKELNKSTIMPEISAGSKVGNKRKRDNLKVSVFDTEFLQLGYDVVQDITGISISELEVLETHTTYSLSEEKSASCFYIMQCPGSFDEHKKVPLKFLVESVQDPLAEKVANGSWKTTRLVNLYHMLPYLELVLWWFSGNNRCGDSSPRQVASPVHIFPSTEKDGNSMNKFVKSSGILDPGESSQNGVDGILENLAGGIEQAQGLSISPSRSRCEMVMDVDNTTEEFEKGCDAGDPTTTVASRITLENPDAKSDDPVYGHSKELIRKTGVDDSLREKLNEKSDVSAGKDERRICPATLDEETVGCGKEIISAPPRVLKMMNREDMDTICSDGGDNMMSNTSIRVYQHRRRHNSSSKIFTQLQEAVPGLRVDVVDILESDHTQRKDEGVSRDKVCLTNVCNPTGNGDRRAQLEAKMKHNTEVQSASDSFRSYNTRRSDEKVSRDEGYLTNMHCQTGTAITEIQQGKLVSKTMQNLDEWSALDSSKSDHQSRDEKISGDGGNQAYECNYTGFAATVNQQAQVKTKSKHDLGDSTMSVSDHLQNALALLYRKRGELYSRICNMEDTLALCEDNVIRIRDAGEIDLARQCIESVMNGTFHSLIENGAQAQDKSNQMDDDNKSQLGNSTKLSEVYIPGKSSCQDLEYACMMNNWRLPRYLTESSEGIFQSNVVVEGSDDFKLHAKGGLESTPCAARETAAAHMIKVMHKTFM